MNREFNHARRQNYCSKIIEKTYPSKRDIQLSNNNHINTNDTSTTSSDDGGLQQQSKDGANIANELSYPKDIPKRILNQICKRSTRCNQQRIPMSVGGIKSAGAYGEVSFNSCHHLMTVLMVFYGLGSGCDTDSCFIDIGSGRGVPATVAAMYGVPSIGVEIDPIIFQSCCGMLIGLFKEYLSEFFNRVQLNGDPKSITLPNSLPLSIVCEDINKISTLDPVTHVFSFDIAMPNYTTERLIRLFNCSNSVKCFITFRQDATIYQIEAEPIDAVRLNMAGSGEVHTAFVYVKWSYLTKLPSDVLKAWLLGRYIRSYNRITGSIPSHLYDLTTEDGEMYLVSLLENHGVLKKLQSYSPVTIYLDRLMDRCIQQGSQSPGHFDRTNNPLDYWRTNLNWLIETRCWSNCWTCSLPIDINFPISTNTKNLIFIRKCLVEYCERKSQLISTSKNTDDRIIMDELCSIKDILYNNNNSSSIGNPPSEKSMHSSNDKGYTERITKHADRTKSRAESLNSDSNSIASKFRYLLSENALRYYELIMSTEAKGPEEELEEELEVVDGRCFSDDTNKIEENHVKSIFCPYVVRSSECQCTLCEADTKRIIKSLLMLARIDDNVPLDQCQDERDVNLTTKRIFLEEKALSEYSCEVMKTHSTELLNYNVSWCDLIDIQRSKGSNTLRNHLIQLKDLVESVMYSKIKFDKQKCPIMTQRLDCLYNRYNQLGRLVFGDYHLSLEKMKESAIHHDIFQKLKTFHFHQHVWYETSRRAGRRSFAKYIADWSMDMRRILMKQHFKTRIGLNAIILNIVSDQNGLCQCGNWCVHSSTTTTATAAATATATTRKSKPFKSDVTTNNFDSLFMTKVIEKEPAIDKLEPYCSSIEEHELKLVNLTPQRMFNHNDYNGISDDLIPIGSSGIVTSDTLPSSKKTKEDPPSIVSHDYSAKGEEDYIKSHIQNPIDTTTTTTTTTPLKLCDGKDEQSDIMMIPKRRGNKLSSSSSFKRSCKATDNLKSFRATTTTTSTTSTTVYNDIVLINNIDDDNNTIGPYTSNNNCNHNKSATATATTIDELTIPKKRKRYRSPPELPRLFNTKGLSTENGVCILPPTFYDVPPLNIQSDYMIKRNCPERYRRDSIIDNDGPWITPHCSTVMESSKGFSNRTEELAGNVVFNSSGSSTPISFQQHQSTTSNKSNYSSGTYTSSQEDPIATATKESHHSKYTSLNCVPSNNSIPIKILKIPDRRDDSNRGGHYDVTNHNRRHNYYYHHNNYDRKYHRTKNYKPGHRRERKFTNSRDRDSYYY